MVVIVHQGALTPILADGRRCQKPRTGLNIEVTTWLNIGSRVSACEFWPPRPLLVGCPRTAPYELHMHV
jgi:hypothetical protein